MDEDCLSICLIKIMIIDQIILWKGNHFITAMQKFIFQSANILCMKKVFYSIFYSSTEYHVTTCQLAIAS
jgi:hypothetical protein